MYISYDEIKKNEEIKKYIMAADDTLAIQGYTEHRFAHAGLVADTARYILQTLGYSEHEIELAQIAGYLHDIGNLVNRTNHAHSGAIMAFSILREIGMDASDIAIIVSAIGNHDEETAVVVNPVAAALILGDKMDVRRTRVRNQSGNMDIHDRVNFSVISSNVVINEEKTTITLELTINANYGTVGDYFEIFLGRMLLCRQAAKGLQLQFKLLVNGQSLI